MKIKIKSECDKMVESYLEAIDCAKKRLQGDKS